ncbi:PspA-associated protein PspAB [Thermomicrobium sp.]
MRRFLDILLGRAARPAPAKLEGLLAIASAAVTMEAQLGFRPYRTAGMVFKPIESVYFERAQEELEGLLRIAVQETQSRFWFSTDSYRYRWIILEDPDFEDLVATIQAASQILTEHGFGEQLLAAVFRFDDQRGQPFFWIYQYKLGAFTPFAPRKGRQRDEALELRLAAVLERELPIERRPELWYALWDIPFSVTQE